MARTASVEKELRRGKAATRALKKRKELKAIFMDVSASDDDRWEALQKFQKLKRDTSFVRFTRRCQLCGRPRAVYRKFSLCRICLRNATMRGDVPGLTKASW